MTQCCNGRLHTPRPLSGRDMQETRASHDTRGATTITTSSNGLEALLSWMRAESMERRTLARKGHGRAGARYAQDADSAGSQKQCLINNEAGSWLLCQAIIFHAPLDPTLGLEQCGSCTRCLDAVRQGRLSSHGVLDSNRCCAITDISRSDGHSSLRLPSGRRSMVRHMSGRCRTTACPFTTDAPWQPRRVLN